MKRRKKIVTPQGVDSNSRDHHNWHAEVAHWWNQLGHIRKATVILLLSIVGSFLLYGNTLPNGFVYDDVLFNQREDLRNPRSLLTVWTESYIPNAPTSGAWRPLAIASYALNFILFGNSSLSFRVTSILIHALVVSLIVFCIYELTKRRDVAILSGLFFLLMPIHVEAVAWNKARDEILATAFMLMSWYAFMRFDQKNNPQKSVSWFLLSVCSLAFAFLSKESAIAIFAFPAAVLIVKKQLPSKRAAVVLGAWVVVTITYLGLRYMVLGPEGVRAQSHDWSFNPLIKENDAGTLQTSTRLLTAAKLYTYYLGKTLLPLYLSATYAYNKFQIVNYIHQSYASLAGIILMFGIIIGWFLTRIRMSVWYMGLVLFSVHVVLYLHLFQVTADIFAERWAYRPSIGVALMCAGMAVWMGQKYQKLTVTMLTGIAIVFSIITLYQNTIWRSDLTLAKSMITTSPQSVRGYVNMTSTLAIMGRFQEAEVYLKKALEIIPDYIVSLDLQAKLYYAQGNVVSAYETLKRLIDIEPTFGTGLINLGRIAYQLGYYEEAEKSFGEFFYQKHKPYSASEVSMFALALIKNGKPDEAIAAIDQYIPEGKPIPRIKYILALAYTQKGQPEEAEKYMDWGGADKERSRLALRDFIVASESAAIESSMLGP